MRMYTHTYLRVLLLLLFRTVCTPVPAVGGKKAKKKNVPFRSGRAEKIASCARDQLHNHRKMAAV